MSERGKLIVISGFSGVGKGTVIGRLMEGHPEYVFSVSATTRYVREGEIHGVHYFFLSKEEFEQGIQGDKFLEYAQYNGNYYGTPRDYVYSQMEQGKNVILDIECQGALQVMEKCPEAVRIFMIAPSVEVLYKRLIGRGTETAEQVRGRMEQTYRELAVVPRYQAILVNDKIDETVQMIKDIVADEAYGRELYVRNLPMLDIARTDLEQLLQEI